MKVGDGRGFDGVGRWGRRSKESDTSVSILRRRRREGRFESDVGS